MSGIDALLAEIEELARAVSDTDDEAPSEDLIEERTTAFGLGLHMGLVIGLSQRPLAKRMSAAMMLGDRSESYRGDAIRHGCARLANAFEGYSDGRVIQ
jgi:hypothetical protein